MTLSRQGRLRELLVWYLALEGLSGVGSSRMYAPMPLV